MVFIVIFINVKKKILALGIYNWGVPIGQGVGYGIGNYLTDQIGFRWGKKEKRIEAGGLGGKQTIIVLSLLSLCFDDIFFIIVFPFELLSWLLCASENFYFRTEKKLKSYVHLCGLGIATRPGLHPHR